MRLVDERQEPVAELLKGLAEDGVLDNTAGSYLPDRRPGALYAAAVVDALRGSRIIGASDPLPYDPNVEY